MLTIVKLNHASTPPPKVVSKEAREQKAKEEAEKEARRAARAAAKANKE